MKLLFISGAGWPDYLCDMLLHGFRALLGPDAVDVNKIWYLYQSGFGPGKKSLTDLPGKGMTLYGLMPDIPVDRGDILKKIQNHFFDLVVFGSIFRCVDYSDQVKAHYAPQDIILIDGEDQTLLRNFIGRGIYFKRELELEIPGVFPLEFSFPPEKICRHEVIKKKLMAVCDPRDASTYIFNDEASYYQDYQQSYFGVTTKKAGWDCLRHYEILANQCAPLFLDLAACPELTMFRYPKAQNLALVDSYRKYGPDYFKSSEGERLYMRLTGQMFEVFCQDLTTVAMARYVLDTWLKVRSGKP